MKKLLPIRAGLRAVCVLIAVASGAACAMARAQAPHLSDPAKQAPPASSPVEKDPLGRSTPRGAVLGFLIAAHKGNFELATQYLQTDLRGLDAQTLASQFAAVLDKRLPARLNQLSESPEGPLLDPLNPNRDVIGIISTDNGEIAVALERIQKPNIGKIWLFSADTLASVPLLFQDVNENQLGKRLPGFLVTRMLGIPLFEWIIVLIGFPVFYGLAVLLNRAYGFAVKLWKRWRREPEDPERPALVPAPIRLLVIAIAMLSVRAQAGLSLLARQFWTNIAVVVALGALAWLLIRLDARAERVVLNHLKRRRLDGTTSILRLARRLVDLLIIFAAILSILFFFGINPSPALAGLGVGGIAIALAAQKTLENVIGGASIILDQVVKVGDSLKFGTVQGTVEAVGLRSTLIRTADRTLVSIPNGQLANMNIEAVSARDKFWFHPMLNLAHGTSAAQMEQVLTGIQSLLGEHPAIEPASLRVRFVAVGAYSLDIEIVAYIYAANWEAFLVIQQELLLGIMHIVEEAGSRIALPSQVVIQGGALPEQKSLPNTARSPQQPDHSLAELEKVR